MLTVKVYNQEGSEVKDLELNEAVFGIEPNKQALFDMVLLQRASLRQGTHKVKNHGVKKVLVELDKDQSVHHNGVEEELYLVQHLEVINLN